jgi:MFS family permease
MWLAGFFFWGHFMDRFSVRKTLALIFLCASTVPFLYLMTRDILVLGAAQGAAGFVFAAVELANYIVVIRMAEPKEVPHYMAASIALGGLRGAAAPFIGTALYARYGAGATFTISLFLMFFSVLLAFALFKKPLLPRTNGEGCL